MLCRFMRERVSEDDGSQCRTAPGYEALCAHDDYGPCGAQLAAYGADCGHAGGVEQTEDHQRQGGGGGEDGAERGACHEAAQGADHNFLGKESADQGGGNAPVAESHRLEDGGDETGQLCQHAEFGMFAHHLQAEVESMHEPDDH